ncbi:hypothetical protein HMN09_01065100 [Mycena chlorophos]|uniref:Uncharacterized protein n=1 Tax=Mycena chlorophos TaxID=658473 RepID=A0A8H6SE12_MYCCL|nr:hypothetical protein HMN09_01065100 [Mycena chlorophos]
MQTLSPTSSLRPCANWVQLIRDIIKPPIDIVNANINRALTVIIEDAYYRPVLQDCKNLEKQWDEMVHPGDRDSYGNQELNGDCLVLVAAERCITKLNPTLNVEERGHLSKALVSNRVFWALLMRMGVCCWPFEKVLANAFEIFCALLDGCDPLEAHGWMVRLFVPLLKRMMGISANPCIEYTVKIYPLAFPVTEPAHSRLIFRDRPRTFPADSTEEKTRRGKGNEDLDAPMGKKVILSYD